MVQKTFKNCLFDVSDFFFDNQTKQKYTVLYYKQGGFTFSAVFTSVPWDTSAVIVINHVVTASIVLAWVFSAIIDIC